MPFSQPSLSRKNSYEHRSAFYQEHHPVTVVDEAGIAESFGVFGSSQHPMPHKNEIQRASEEQAIAVRTLMLIRAYRSCGHTIASLDPLGLRPIKYRPELDPATYGFKSDSHLDQNVFLDNVLGLQHAKVRDVLRILKKTYAGKSGIEFVHISKPSKRLWIQERIEHQDFLKEFPHEEKKSILQRLIYAEEYEHFLARKYVGTKRFGCEGAESMIVALEEVIMRAAHSEVKDVVLGMAHRGRLNVITNVIKEPARFIFHKFQGESPHENEAYSGSGDVKYHLGISGDRFYDEHKIHLSLAANPSHLEAIVPVILGKARARQDMKQDEERVSVLPLLVHGDAAFSGQGVVAECFGLSDLKGNRTGGSIHVVVNNQIGFTTLPRYGRSSHYPSDIAKMVEAPIFHVNGDDPEAVVRMARLALAFRQRYRSPVVLDIFCYRRHGHNESDEPKFTQPLMYDAIAKKETTASLYAQKLINTNVLSQKDVKIIREDYRTYLKKELAQLATYSPSLKTDSHGAWQGLKRAKKNVTLPTPKTGISLKKLKDIGNVITYLPLAFTPHRMVKKLMEKRFRSVSKGQNIDWGTAEALCFGSLLKENFTVRLSGQDVERGTFSHRHAVLVDQKTATLYTPLRALAQEGQLLEVVNSMLSEVAVLGFEYGYSLSRPGSLTLWEAQFGDFANGAQVCVDQFLSCGEEKWLRMSGLVMLLPHGYEGQGSEHSSARPERYLQLCAGHNIQVANCTTPANYFHILRRQLHQEFRKPLILFTPKSLLRHKLCVSSIEGFSVGSSFQKILQDDSDHKAPVRYCFDTPMSHRLVDDSKIKRVVLCSGKVYYDLFEERERRGIKDVYLLRLEQIYPFPKEQVMGFMRRFSNADWVWCQEEPKNMGAWYFVAPLIQKIMKKVFKNISDIVCFSRQESASPATGWLQRHLSEKNHLMEQTLLCVTE